MKIAVLEFVTGGGMRDVSIEEIPASLLREGQAMLQALVTDCLRLSDCEVVTCWDARLGQCELPSSSYRGLDEHSLWYEQWQSIAMESDAVIVIAPELENQLFKIVTALRKNGIHVLNADSNFIQATSDKWLTAQSFQSVGIAHPPTWLLSDFLARDIPQAYPNLSDGGWIVKPRDGAGCHRTSYFRSHTDIVERIQSAWLVEKQWTDYIVQPWLEGTAASVAVICGPRDRVILPAMTQAIARDDRSLFENIQYCGGTGPMKRLNSSDAERFSNTILDALPGTALGWIGIDFLVTDAGRLDESIVAIEVNPRLTTSYLGLREIVQENLADLLIRTALGQSVSYSISGRTIEFHASGNVSSKPKESN